MKQRLFLHIGLGKTGTTAIQHFCAENEAVLEKHGIVYSPHRIYEHWPVVDDPYDKALEFIDKNIGRKSDLLISDESIYLKFAADPHAVYLKEKYPDLDIHVIVYLRRQDLHLESLVNFLQFTGSMENPIEWVDFPSKFKTPFPGMTAESYDYYAWLHPLSETLGKGRVHVRVYDPKRFVGGSIIPDFLDVLGVPFTEEFTLPKSKANPSLDSRFTKLLQDFYSKYPTQHSFERRIVAQAMGAANVSMGITRKRSLFSSDERVQFLEYFEKGNTLISKEFLNEDSPLFDMAVSDGDADCFKEGELELLPGVLNKVWFDTLSDMTFGAFNTFKMKMYQDRYHSGDESARKKYLFHKFINTIMKRCSKAFFTPIKWRSFDAKRK